jgi:hypothetical protein
VPPDGGGGKPNRAPRNGRREAVPQEASGKVSIGQDDDTVLEAPLFCPKRRKPMKKRTAKRGDRRGELFGGCAGFPSCPGTRPI